MTSLGINFFKNYNNFTTGGFLLLQIDIPNLYPKLLHPVHSKNKVSQGTPPCWNLERGLHNRHCQKAATFGPEPIWSLDFRSPNSGTPGLTVPHDLFLLDKWSPSNSVLSDKSSSKISILNYSIQYMARIRYLRALPHAEIWNRVYRNLYCQTPIVSKFQNAK